MDDTLSLDCLPFDCIVTICEYLTAEDLVRFGRACSLFLEATHVGYLWRRLSLGRWLFCDVRQITEGPHRWKRYFTARRRVEAKMDTGKPLRDYRVRTLRSHENEVVSVVVMGERRGRKEEDINWENPSTPLVISLSSDGCVKVWDVIQGMAVWSSEGEQVSSLTGSESRGEMALGRSDGSVQLWNVDQWILTSTFHASGGVTRLMYGNIETSSHKTSPQTYLIVHTLNQQIQLWNCDDVIANVADTPVPEPAKPVLELLSSSNAGQCCLSLSGLLSFEATHGEMHVFDLPSLFLTTTPSRSPHRPNATLHTDNLVTASCWVEPRYLATATGNSINVDIWDVGGRLDAMARSHRSVYDGTNMYSPTRTIDARVPPLCMGVTNELLITGDGEGCVRVIDIKSGELLQTFQDHRGRVTDMYIDRFRVLSCSSDFSIRVYRWVKASGTGAGTSSSTARLESRYTLLGGSVALKQHDGFSHLLCATSCCVGVAGKQLKFYTFSASLQPTAS